MYNGPHYLSLGSLPVLLPSSLCPSHPHAHNGMISAMVCSKEYVFTSSFGCIKVRSYNTFIC